ncbi:MAG: hypothetical protein OXI54_03900 [Chloroflexota bacterium]|nr:hypothetical protein [Chloroflexota bacterium]MDE2683272.1 hypothetical protein [Chloroflexota bacterium]
MTINNLRQAIVGVQQYVAEFDPQPGSNHYNYQAAANNSEMSTRYIIIDPILNALGWCLSNPSECIVENFTEGGKPDYTLLDDEGEAVIVIEAKRIDGDTRYKGYSAQLARYADSYPAIDVAVITNGQYWDIYYYDDVEGEVIPEFIDENGRERPLGLHWHHTQTTAWRLHHRLWKGHYWR